MIVSVMNVRVMRMRVPHRKVFVRMTVRFARRVIRAVFVSMVFIVDVTMVVRHRLVVVFVLVTLGQMQPHSHAHEKSREEENGGEFVAQQQD